MVNSFDISHWHADADEVCHGCADELYGSETVRGFGGSVDVERVERLDREGNPVSPIFVDNVGECLGESGRATCGNCGGVIAEWCDLCDTDNHATGDHGEPLVTLDHGRDTAHGIVVTKLNEALSVIDAELSDMRLVKHGLAYAVRIPHFVKIRAKLVGYQNEARRALDIIARGEARGLPTDEALNGYMILDELHADIDEALDDAEYLAFDDGDAGAWFVYRQYP